MVVFMMFSMLFAACGDSPGSSADVEKPSMLYQGHASVRITSRDGVVIYIDPASGKGYDLPADLILVTHSHTDHNMVSLVKKRADDCTIITNKEALVAGEYKTFSVKGVEIEAVEAKNGNHSSGCVGYIVTVDGVKIYHAGDTDKTKQMETFAAKEIDYALLPCDGNFNMDAAEAAECARIIGAKHNVPIHTKNGKLFDDKVAEGFDAPNKLIIQPGEEIAL